VLARLEDLAQLLALWRPGAWGQEREQAYLDAQFAGVRPNYLHPSMSRVLASTYGQLVYVDQLVAVIKLLGFEHGWAERFRRTIIGGRRAAERNDMERLQRRPGWWVPCPRTRPRIEREMASDRAAGADGAGTRHDATTLAPDEVDLTATVVDRCGRGMAEDRVALVVGAILDTSRVVSDCGCMP
jgi:hypothetical protein